MQQRLPSLLDPPAAFAHRGARAHAPENTLDAFALALRLGANGLESDIWLTADGIAVLDHDGVVKSGLRRTPIRDFRRSQLPGHIPSLAEMLDHCGSEFHLSLDVKDVAAGPTVISTVRDVAPALMPRLWLCQTTWESLVPLRALDADVKLVESTRLAKITGGVERRAAVLAEHGIDALNMHHSDWNGGLVALVHRFGRYTLSWDLQFERLIADHLRMGHDGIFSDWTDRMMDVYASEVGRP